MSEYLQTHGSGYSLGHWCEFCRTYHSSMTCYHPGSQVAAQYEEMRQRAERAEVEMVRLRRVLEAAERCLNYCGHLCETSYRCDLRAALKGLDVHQEEKAK